MYGEKLLVFLYQLSFTKSKVVEVPSQSSLQLFATLKFQMKVIMSLAPTFYSKGNKIVKIVPFVAKYGDSQLLLILKELHCFFLLTHSKFNFILNLFYLILGFRYENVSETMETEILRPHTKFHSCHKGVRQIPRHRSTLKVF